MRWAGEEPPERRVAAAAKQTLAPAPLLEPSRHGAIPARRLILPGTEPDKDESAEWRVFPMEKISAGPRSKAGVEHFNERRTASRRPLDPA